MNQKTFIISQFKDGWQVYIIEFISYTLIKFLSKVFYRKKKNLVTFFYNFLKIRKSYREDSILLVYITKPTKKKQKL